MAALRTDGSLIKDDISVLSAMAMRQDRDTRALLDLMHALTEQQNASPTRSAGRNMAARFNRADD